MTRYLAMNEWSHSFTLGPVSAYDNSTNESSKGSFREDNRQTYEHSSSVDTDNLSNLCKITMRSSLLLFSAVKQNITYSGKVAAW